MDIRNIVNSMPFIEYCHFVYHEPTDCILYRLIYCINFRTDKTCVCLYIVVPINCQNPFIPISVRNGIVIVYRKKYDI